MEKRGMKAEMIIIGGSAGSLQVILQMLKKLQSPVAAPILLVLHRKAQSANILQTLLQQFSPVDVIEADDKTEIRSNTLYIAPADYHLLFEDTKNMSLDSSEKMNYSRPSIDVTFRSAAEIFGAGLVAVLLSGANADGVEGLAYVKKNGGRVWVQDPETAEVDYMPRRAMEEISYDLLIRPEELADHIQNI